MAKESIDHWWYAEKIDLSTSVRGGMEPLIGLKASCASLVPMTRSQLRAFSGFGAPFGRVKLSTTRTNEPWVPGWLT